MFRLFCLFSDGLPGRDVAVTPNPVAPPPPGTPIPPPAPVFMVFHSDGTLTGSGAANDSALSGVWTRVADRKFLVTYVVFNYNEARAVVSIAKIG